MKSICIQNWEWTLHDVIKNNGLNIDKQSNRSGEQRQVCIREKLTQWSVLCICGNRKTEIRLNDRLLHTTKLSP